MQNCFDEIINNQRRTGTVRENQTSTKKRNIFSVLVRNSQKAIVRASSYDPGYRDGSVSGMNFAVRSYGKFHPGYRDEKW